MENPGSSIISALGAGSGIDFIQLADDLSEASFSFRRTSLEARNETLEARISSASLLRNSLTQLASALGDRVRTGDLAPNANVSDPALVDVSTTSGIVPNASYSLEVSQLADSQTLVSNGYSSKDDLVGEGSLTVRFGEVVGATFTQDANQSALNITVEATDTLETLAAKISSESGGDLQAYVAEGTSGAQLVIKGQDGAQSGFVLEPVSGAASPSAVPGDLSYLAWAPSTDAGELRKTAQDALFELDSVEMSSSSNTVTGLPEGITLELKSTNPGAPASISFSTDSGAVTSLMTDLTAALNDLAGQLNEEGTSLGGTLGNDAGARELRRDLARLAGETVMPSADDGEPSTLGDLGLGITREGTFELDTERLSDAISSNPEGVAAMFTAGAFGVFATIDGLARDNTLSTNPGTLGGSVGRYEAQIERNDEKLEQIASQQENMRNRLARQLLSAEQAVTASQSTLNFLQLQVQAQNNSN